MSKKGKVIYTLCLIYKLYNDDVAEKLISEVENTPSIYPEITDYTISTVIKAPYIYIEITLDNIELEKCMLFSTTIKDYFYLSRIVSIETRYITKTDENQVMERFYND